MSDSDDEQSKQPQPLDENADLPALFWDALPENAEEHPDFAAIEALKAECTPEERAENYKAGLCTAARMAINTMSACVPCSQSLPPLAHLLYAYLWRPCCGSRKPYQSSTWDAMAHVQMNGCPVRKFLSKPKRVGWQHVPTCSVL